MYLPPKLSGSTNQALELMQTHPFATVLSVDESGDPFISHLPLLVESDPSDGKVKLFGHVSRHNPQWRHFLMRPRAQAIFHGPHAYISPQWYVSGRDVPTWNYAACHVSGPVRLIEAYDELILVLQRLSQVFEAPRAKPWEFELPDDLNSKDSLTNAIVGFEIAPDKIETKLKLSQTRTREDRKSVIAGLRQGLGEMNHAVAELMEKSLIEST